MSRNPESTNDVVIGNRGDGAGEHVQHGPGFWPLSEIIRNNKYIPYSRD